MTLDPKAVNRINRQIIFMSRPKRLPEASHFGIRECPIPAPSAGEVLVRIAYLSIDPWLRPAMNHPTLMPTNAVVPGDVVGRVIESKHAFFRRGDFVQGLLGWQNYAAAPWYVLRKINPDVAPVSTALGILGSPGLAAYFGLFDVARIRPGESVVVSAAAGAVGSAAAQIAKLAGCRVIGIAGSEEKVRYLTEELRLDAALNYKVGPEWRSQLAMQCPFGVDVYFDNVGGPVSDTVFHSLSMKARVAVCGQISEYDRSVPPRGLRWLSVILEKRARVEGFLVSDFAQRFPEALRFLTIWLKAGLLRYRETIEHGLENAPRAFSSMLQGRNVGKQLVKVE